jgi:PEP-CTERM motif
MKPRLLCACSLGFILLTAMIITVPPRAGWAASLAPCPVAPVSTYDATGFACTVSDKIFSNFSLAGLGDASTVSPVTTPLNPGLTFTFAPPLSSGSGLPFIPQGFFTVSTLSGAPLIDDASETLHGANVAGSGGGSVRGDVLLTYTFGIPNCFGCVGNLGSLTATDTNPSVTSPFTPINQSGDGTPPTPVSTLNIEDDFSLSSGSTGDVTLAGQTFTVSEVPEPGTLALLGPVAAGWLLRKRPGARAG